MDSSWVTDQPLPWLALMALGAYHGLNPGMGWLFAVARGLQERRRGAVLRALGPIAVGHALSITVVLLLVGLIQLWVPTEPLRLLGGGALVIFGLYKLIAPLSHPRWVGLRVGARDLVAWSFLMATAHGAGLMLIPVLPRLRATGSAQPLAEAHAHHVALSSSAATGLAANDLLVIAVHSAAMLLAMGLLALIVYEKLGLAILRRAWFNLDRLWAGALLLAGGLTLAT